MARPAALEVDSKTWAEEALDYLVRHARLFGHVTADDLRDMPEPPPHPNAVGNLFKQAKAQGVLVKVWPHESTAGTRNGGGSYAWGLHPDQLRGEAR